MELTICIRHKSEISCLSKEIEILYISPMILTQTNSKCNGEFQQGIVCDDIYTQFDSIKEYAKRTGRIVYVHPRNRQTFYLQYTSDIVNITTSSNHISYLQVLKVFNLTIDSTLNTFLKQLKGLKGHVIILKGGNYQAFPHKNIIIPDGMRNHLQASGILLNHNVAYPDTEGIHTARSMLVPQALLPDLTRILIVDDCMLSIHCLLEMLNSLHNYNIDTTQSGEEALKLLNKTTYTIIFIDIDLPDISGVELSSQIKNSQPNAKRVGYTACDYSHCNTFDKCIKKPISMKSLAKVIYDYTS